MTPDRGAYDPGRLVDADSDVRFVLAFDSEADVIADSDALFLLISEADAC